MGIFSRRSELSSILNVLKVLAGSLIKLDVDSRKSLGPIFLGSVNHYLRKRQFEPDDINNALQSFQILSGTVGVTPNKSIESDTATSEIQELISENFPFDMVIVITLPLRHMMIEYFYRRFEDEKSRESAINESYSNSDMKKTVECLIMALSTLNSLCLDGTIKSWKHEFVAMSELTTLIITNLDFQLSK
jgi:hypothetical protein